MQQEYPRPEISLEKKPVDIFFEMMALLSILFMWGFCFYNYNTLPDIIPVHWGPDGLADNYGSKKTIFLLPVIISTLTFGLRVLNKYPHKFNYMSAITTENAERQYKMATRLIRYLQFIISLVFTYIVVKTVNDARLQESRLSIWFLIFFFAALFVPIVYTVYSALTSKKSKVKTQNA